MVDDDADLVEVLGLGLTSAGYSVAVATNGLEALELARSWCPDLIVLDLVLPEMDGFAVCDALRQRRETASVPVLMLTGLTSPLNRSTGLKCGADDYVQKPITVSELLGKIRPLLTHSPGAAVEQPLDSNVNEHSPGRRPSSAKPSGDHHERI